MLCSGRVCLIGRVGGCRQSDGTPVCPSCTGSAAQLVASGAGPGEVAHDLFSFFLEPFLRHYSELSEAGGFAFL